MSEARVDTPISAYERMARRWRLPRTLMGGTWALRQQAVTNLSTSRKGQRLNDSDITNRAFHDYLPRNSVENDERYLARISRSVLHNRFKSTIKHLVGKPFAQPIGVRDDNPTEVEDWSENIDLSGRNLTVFAQSVFEDAWVTGLSYILVDFPVVETAGVRTRTRADDRKEGVRPYFTHIPPEDIIGWRVERQQGRDVLTQLRIKESALVPEGDFGEKEVNRVRVLYPDHHELWEEEEDRQEFQLIGEGAISLGFIPLVPVYTGRTGFMEALPPLEDLAFTNSLHWQVQSDQNNILHVAGVPILFGTGLNDDENSITVGTDGLYTASDPNAKLSYVELMGKSIESREKELQRLDDQMVVLGLQPQLSRTGGVTATATAMEGARADSQLKGGVEGLRDALELAFQYAGRWMGQGEDWAGSLDIYTGFELGIRDAATIDSLIKARAAGEITRETFLRGLKRYEVLWEDFDVEDELEALEGEAMQAGPVGADRAALRETMRARGMSDEEISAMLDSAMPGGAMPAGPGSATGPAARMQT